MTTSEAEVFGVPKTPAADHLLDRDARIFELAGLKIRSSKSAGKLIKPSLRKRDEAISDDAAGSAADTPYTSKPDPNFMLWQQRANERLRAERNGENFAPHRLAAEHPDDVIVVCEAGCRGAPEEIVQSIPKSEQVQTTAYVTTAADDAQSDGKPSKVDAQAIAARQQDANEIICLGGCYDSPRVHKAREVTPMRHGAVTAPDANARQAATNDEAPARYSQTAINGAIVTLAHSAIGGPTIENAINAVQHQVAHSGQMSSGKN